MRKADPRSFVGMLWLVISILVAIGQCFAEKGINDALIDAATRGDLSDVNTALDKGADVNARDKFGRTPLHWAAYKGHVEAMKSLLSRGADIDSQRMEESHVPRHPISLGPLSTPLYSAILNKKLDAAKFLILKGANVTARNEGSSTPLLLMCSLGSRTPTPYPGSLRRSIPKNRFPWSFDPPQGFNCDASSAEIVGLLLDNGADANPRAEPGSTPLMAACRNGCLEIVKLLIARGAEVNGQNKFGMTALDMACSEANSEIVKFLLENGANVATEWDKEGHVSLHMGTWVFCPEVTKAILAKHIDRKADFGTILHFASFVGQTETVRLLLEYGGNINARDRIGFATLLQEAHETSWADFVASANKAYDISALSRNEWYRTYQRGKRHWLFELIDYSGSDRAPCTGVSDVQTIGATALHWASLGGQPEVVRLLLANGADPKAVDDEGHSALHVACAIHNPEVAKLLIDNGANVNQKDRKERTPLAWALNTAGSGPFWSTAGGVYSVDNEAGVSGLRWADIHCDFSESNYKKLIELLKAAGAEK